MEPIDDLTDEQRCSAIARVLAAGVLRSLILRNSGISREENPSQTSPGTSPQRLELSDETVLNVKRV